MSKSVIRECYELLLESADINQQIRGLLNKIIVAARHRFKSESPYDLADDLEELLQKASLAKPPALSDSQYNAVAEVWSELGEESPDIGAIASRALMRLSP